MKAKLGQFFGLTVALSSCYAIVDDPIPPKYLGGWSFGGGVGVSTGSEPGAAGSLEVSKAWAYETVKRPVPVVSFGSVLVGTRQSYWYGEGAIRGPAPLPSPTLGIGCGLNVIDSVGPAVHLFASIPIPANFLGDWILTGRNIPYVAPFYRPRFSLSDRTWSHEFGLQFKIFVFDK